MNFSSRPHTEDSRMVSFVARWGPFEHGDEYILPEFGIAPWTFYRRVLALVREVPPPAMRESERERVIGLCLAKLAALSASENPRTHLAGDPPNS
ncbi:hypothetical protein A5784_23680 [Mycobacterium sp. 852013-50091_SCH5140682]|nr:hypothetical protein A5784_23680 [Mycobacterium sp. 852013-50091_SCH5140682]